MNSIKSKRTKKKTKEKKTRKERRARIENETKVGERQKVGNKPKIEVKRLTFFLLIEMGINGQLGFVGKMYDYTQRVCSNHNLFCRHLKLSRTASA